VVGRLSSPLETHGMGVVNNDREKREGDIESFNKTIQKQIEPGI